MVPRRRLQFMQLQPRNKGLLAKNCSCTDVSTAGVRIHTDTARVDAQSASPTSMHLEAPPQVHAMHRNWEQLVATGVP